MEYFPTKYSGQVVEASLRTDARRTGAFRPRPSSLLQRTRTPALGNCYAPGDKCEAHRLSDWFPTVRELAGARTFPPDRPYYLVESAFAGLAVYKASLLRGARYTGTSVDGRPECEHVPFHAAIRRQFPGARIVVATYMYSGL